MMVDSQQKEAGTGLTLDSPEDVSVPPAPNRWPTSAADDRSSKLAEERPSTGPVEESTRIDGSESDGCGQLSEVESPWPSL